MVDRIDSKAVALLSVALALAACAHREEAAANRPLEPALRIIEARALVPVSRAELEENGLRWTSKGEPDFVLDREAGIGYVRIIRFGDDTESQLTTALEDLARVPLRGLVLDLRDSTGGKAAAAIACADLLLDSGTIVTTIQRGQEEVRTARPGALTDAPIVLLINGATASSSEIFAGALADNGRALLIGERTWGKGRIQQKIALGEGLGGLMLTTGTFQRPSGATFDRHDAARRGDAGIKPDPTMEVVLSAAEHDAWLTAASRLDAPFVLDEDEQKFDDRILDVAVAAIRPLCRTF